LLHFALAQLSNPTGGEPAKLNVPDTYPFKVQHRMAGGLGDDPNLALASLGEDHSQPASGVISEDRFNELGPDGDTLDGCPLAERAERGLVQLSADLDAILLLHAVAGMHDVVRPLSVICQQHQSGAVLVEAPDGIDTLGHVYKLHDRALVVRGLAGGHKADGLVQGQVAVGFQGHRRAIDHDPLARLDGIPEHDRPSINGDTALANEILSSPPGGDAGRG
jgi:hypothetical protein